MEAAAPNAITTDTYRPGQRYSQIRTGLRVAQRCISVLASIPEPYQQNRRESQAPFKLGSGYLEQLDRISRLRKPVSLALNHEYERTCEGIVDLVYLINLLRGGTATPCFTSWTIECKCNVLISANARCSDGTLQCLLGA